MKSTPEPRDPFNLPTEKAKQEPKQETWTPVPGQPHLERNQDGKLRTNIPLNRGFF